MVPPPWRGAGRFVAWLSTSVSNYSKAGSCLWAAAPVPGVLMMSFFFSNFAFNGLGSRGHREVCTSFKSLLKMLSDSGRFSSGHFRWKEKNRFIFSPVSSLRLMPSSLPNGSASVEPTPRWPVVGTLMGGRAHQRQPSFPTTHRAFPTTHNTQQHTTHKTQCITYNPHSLTLTHSLTHPLTHSPTHPHTHTQSLTHSLTPSLPPSLTRSLTHFTSLHFTSLTHSLTHSHTSSSSPSSSSSSSCASDVYQPQGMQKEITKCAAALERVQNITLVSGSMVSTPSFW